MHKEAGSDRARKWGDGKLPQTLSIMCSVVTQPGHSGPGHSPGLAPDSAVGLSTVFTVPVTGAQNQRSCAKERLIVQKAQGWLLNFGKCLGPGS